MFGTSGQKNLESVKATRNGAFGEEVGSWTTECNDDRHVDLVLRDIARTPRIEAVAGGRDRRGSR